MADDGRDSTVSGYGPPAGSTPAGETPGDDPHAYIALDRRAALAAGTAIPDRLRGTGLFADVSGFTPLTERLRLELGAQRGVEVLTAYLDRAFHGVIEAVHRFGGNVIYFSGDAITAWFDGDDGRRAAASALAIRSAMGEVGRVTTPGGTVLELTVKVALATGQVRRAVVGDPDIQRLEVLAGGLLDRLAEAERVAAPGDIVVDHSTMESLGSFAAYVNRLTLPGSGRRAARLRRLSGAVADARAVEPPALPEQVIREWLLPVVFERISTGRGEFVAELRPAYPVFVRFAGIDFDADAGAIDTLDRFVTSAQRVFDRFGGSVLQLTLGDKGANLYGVFGSPVSHEDDGARAAAAALELLKLQDGAGVTDLAIGMAWGALRSGTYGHSRRRTFVCLGDAVNTAARLMSAAPAGQIYAADAVRHGAGDGYRWKDLEPLQLKGKSQSLAAAALLGVRQDQPRRRLRYELPMYGRDAELAILTAALDDALEGDSRVVAVAGEAGLGKSRLIAEFVRAARQRGVLVAFGESQTLGVSGSYFVWQEVWRRLLGIADEEDPARQRQAVEDAVAALDPALLPRAPLIGDVVGVSMPDSELTAAFDAKLRKNSLEDLLAQCLRRRAGDEPVVIVLEDGQWIDGLSRELLQALARAVRRSRVLFVLAYRGTAQPGGGLGLERLDNFLEIALETLAPEAARRLIDAKARHVFGVEAPPALAERIAARAEGNPFYAEELLNYIAGAGQGVLDEHALTDLQLPDTLHSLILSRIDALRERPRQTLKVAGVIGRLFRATMLPGVYPAMGDLAEIVEHLGTLSERDLVALDQAETLTYLFRHVVTQEVSYASMPFALRSTLHRRVGEYIEVSEADDLEPHLDVLAHHFWLGDDADKKHRYLLRAEESARRRYANDLAIDYGERLLTLVDGPARADVLLRLGKVLELTGDWGRAEQVAREALELAGAAGEAAIVARCEAALAEVARKHGNYDEAFERLTRAAETFREVADETGLGVVYHVFGTIAAQRGDLPGARRAYQQSLEIRTRLNDRAALASLHSNLAIVAQFDGDHEEARKASERALEIRRDVGDIWGLGVSHNNIGMIDYLGKHHAEARERFEEAIRCCAEAGDPWMVALARNNLGNAARELGDYTTARRNYAASLETYHSNDDLWALSFLLEDLAMLASRTGAESAAFELLGAAEMLRERIGSPRDAEQQAEIDSQLRQARQALGTAAMTAALARGWSWSVTEAMDRAQQFARDPPSP